jgi:molybdate transport system ATP-binding protein
MLLEMNVNLRRGSFNLNTKMSVNESTTGLFGTSGAGKSTLLGLIAGTLVPQKGRIVLEGKTLFDSRKGIVVPREQRPISAVLQMDSMPGEATVRDRMRDVYDRTLRQRRMFKPGRLVDILELESVMAHKLDELSAGERQRVAIAYALLKSPRMLLLDEPFAPLGLGFRSQLLPLLRRVRDEFKLPVLYASHTLGEILDLTHQLIVLEDGRVLSSGTFKDLTRQEAVRDYLGVRQVDNILSVTITAHDAEAGCTLARTYGIELVLPLRPLLPIDSVVQVLVKSSDIALSRQYLAGISIQNQIKGRICALVPTGDSVLVQIDCGSTVLAGITTKACRDMGLQEGDAVYCLVKTQCFGYLGEPDALPFRQVLNFVDGLSVARPKNGRNAGQVADNAEGGPVSSRQN